MGADAQIPTSSYPLGLVIPDWAGGESGVSADMQIAPAQHV